jgi:hypothetical protein
MTEVRSHLTLGPHSSPVMQAAERRPQRAFHLATEV